MVRSMTGFGRADLERDGIQLSAEIRSVNHRYSEISVRLPRALQDHEARVRKLLGESVARGKVSLTVTAGGVIGETGTLALDVEATDRLVGILRDLKARYRLTDEIDLRLLSRFPDLIRAREAAVDPERLWGLLAEVVRAAVLDFLRTREAEGESLRRDLAARIDRVETGLRDVEVRSPSRVEETKEKLRSRIATLLGEGEVPAERIALEAALLADRLDTTEECVRLRSHIEQFRELLAGDSAAGRKLNFLLQEMNREVNTIGAKANDVATARTVIGLKEEIEILREQVQNIE
jgi:uncharacterized protein (TIGR00255 family)